MKSCIDPKWEKIHAEKEWGQYPTEYTIRFIARNYYGVKDRSKVRMLDYGCGGGSHTWYLAREGFDVWAFDGAPSAIHNVELRMQREKLNAHLAVCDALKLPYEDGFFDAVIDSYCVTMNTAVEGRKMYQEIYRILKEGGALQTAQFGKNTDGYRTGTRIEENTWTEMDNIQLHDVGKIHFTDKDEMENMLKEIGFTNINVDTILYTDRGVKIEQIIACAYKPKKEQTI
ncbi:MAG: class I SAM-dependent methyltransferase [Lachnospiraceae bacterium]|nr:class I SAM-dependent methyltransferase [Lachnospiraceae bacterium]